MLKIYNIKDKPEYLEEIISLTINMWGTIPTSKEELTIKINKKIDKIKELWDCNDYCKLVLLDDDELIGFISIFPHDCDERPDLTPWYATMYVKEKFRGKGYSKLLNDALLKEAKKRGYKKIYLKTDLVNYYEKFGAIFLENINNSEKLYCFNL